MVKALNIILIAVAYVLLLNITVFLMPYIQLSITENQTIVKGGTNENVGLGDTVTVKVEKTRWYGKIESNGINSHLYFLGVIPIPLMIEGYNLNLIHTLFILIMLVYLIFIFIDFERGYKFK